MTASPRPKLLAGTLAVALLLAASRWGSYIGASPIFLTDILIACALLHTIVNGLTSRRNRPHARMPLPYRLFLGYAILVGLVTLGRDPTLIWLRDLVPFLYAGLALLAAGSYARSDDAGRARTRRFLTWALGFHAAWGVVAIQLGNASAGLFTVPLIGAPVFQIRPDIDGALLSIAAGLLMRHLVISGKRPVLTVLAIIWCSYGVAHLPSRASLLTLVVCLVVVFVSVRSVGSTSRRLVVGLVAIVAVGAGLAVLPATDPGQRILATIGVQEATTVNQQSAQGTFRARQKTWAGVNYWSQQDPVRRVFGSGFGNNFLDESRVTAYVAGTDYENVRSPHNWFIGTLARLGLVGLFLALLTMGHLGFTVWRIRSRMATDPLLMLAGLTVASVFTVSMFGVVLEAPFGAVPFWWAAGLVYAARDRSRREAPAEGGRDRIRGKSSRTSVQRPLGSALQGRP